jgi:energy-converting hydrogenase Eha subunit E
MKRRIRIAGATMMVAAGLIGAVAAPASAEPPVVNASSFVHHPIWISLVFLRLRPHSG